MPLNQTKPNQKKINVKQTIIAFQTADNTDHMDSTDLLNISSWIAIQCLLISFLFVIQISIFSGSFFFPLQDWLMNEVLLHASNEH